MDVAVNTGLLSGFSSRPRTLAGLDPARPDRLVLRTAFRWVPAAAVLAGLLVLAWFFGDFVPPLVLAVPAGATGILFGLRRWAILDRGDGVLRQGWGLLFPWRLAAAPLAGVRAVTLERVEALVRRGKGGSHYVTRYWAGLFNGDGVRRLAVTANWEDAVPLTEAMARFLSLPIDDRSQDAIRRLEDLDRGLGEAASDETTTSNSRSSPERYQVEERPDGSLLVRIPQPRNYTYFAVCGMIFLVWTLPAWANDALPIGLAPLVVMLLVAVKMAFGFRSELALSAAGLEIRTFGLGLRRVTVFPLAELEELALLQPEQGGLRGLQTEVFAGVLVARSDKASVRFGHGLDRAGLESLRALLRARLVELHRQAAPAAARAWGTAAGSGGESHSLPYLYRPLLPALGLALGAAAGHFAAGRLGACLACPFAEHGLNVGGLLGAAAALWFDRRRWQRFWGPASWTAVFAALVSTSALGLLRPGQPPFWPAPAFDEAAWLAGAAPSAALPAVAWMLAVLAAAPLVLSLAGLPIRLALPEGRLAALGPEPEPKPSSTARRRIFKVALVAAMGATLAVSVGIWQRQALLDLPRGSAEAPPTPGTAPEEVLEPAPGTAPLPAEAAAGEADQSLSTGSAKPAVRIPVEWSETPAGFTLYRFGGGLDQVQFMPVAVDGPDVWVGTGGGLLRYRPDRDFAELFNAQSGLPGERITALAVDGGRVAFDLARMTGPGTCTGLGVFRLDPERPRWRRVLGGAWDLQWDGAILWAALGGELDSRGEPGGPVRQYRPDRDGPLHGSVSCLAVSPAEVWCGMFGDYDRTTDNFQGGGVSRLDRRTGAWAHYTTADGLARDYTCSLAADGREVWAAHWDEARGLSRYDCAAGRWSAVPRGAGGEAIGGTRLALDGPVVWAGQQGGLVRMERDSLKATVYREADGLPGYIIGGIAVAPDGVWVSAYSYDGQGGIRSAGLAFIPR